MLGDGQRDAGGEDPLDHRVVGGVEQQHQFAGGGPLLQRVADGGGVGVGQPHGGEDDAERLAAGGRLGGDLGRPAPGGAGRPRRTPAASGRAPAWSGASMAETPVSTGSAGGSRRVGLSGAPPTGARRRAEDRRAAVERLAAAVADPAQPARADRDAQRAAGEGDRGCPRVDARRCPPAPGRRRGRGRPRAPGRGAARPSASRMLANSSQPTPATPATTSERAAQLADAVCTSIQRPGTAPHVHAPPSVRSQHRCRAGRATPAASSGPASSRARSSGAKSASSIAAAGDPAVDQLLGSGRRPSSTASTSAAVFAGRAVRVVGLTARSAAARASRSSRPASSTIRSRAGQRGDADQLGQRGQPVGLGEQRRPSAPAAAPSPGSPLRACQAPIASASRRERAGPGRPPGSAGRRRGRGRGSTGSARTAGCGR